MGFSDGTVKPIQVRTNADQTILYISIDGGPAIEMARDGGGSDYGSYSVESEAGTQFADLDYYSSDSNYVYFENNDVWGDGQYGMEALTGTALYQGYTYAYGENSSLWGDMTIGVDFASGGLIGFMSGAHESYGEEEESFNEVFGSISGVVSGSRMAGVMDINSGSVSGELDMLGAFYGVEGRTLAGGLGGTVNGETMGGEFTTSTGRRECCFGEF